MDIQWRVPSGRPARNRRVGRVRRGHGRGRGPVRVPGDVWLFGGLALAALVARLGTGQSVPELALLVALVLLAASLAYWLVGMQTALTVRRDLSAREVSYGMPLVQRIVLRPRSRAARLLMRWAVLSVADRFVVPGLPGTGLAGAVAGGEIVDEREAAVVQRGVWQQGPTDLTISAPLGVLRYRRPLAPAELVTVYPPIVRLARLAWHSGAPDERRALVRSRDEHARRRPPTVVGQRPYHPGDPLAWVNWAAPGTERGEWHTRQFARAARPGVLLVVDPEAATADSERAARRLDTLAAAAASVAWHLLTRPGSPGVALLTAEAPACVAQNADEAPQLLRRLAAVGAGAAGAGDALLRTLQRERGQLLAGIETIVVCSCRSPEIWRDAQWWLTRGSGRGATPLGVHCLAIPAHGVPTAPATRGASGGLVGQGGQGGQVIWLGEDWGEWTHLARLATALEGRTPDR